MLEQVAQPQPVEPVWLSRMVPLLSITAAFKAAPVAPVEPVAQAWMVPKELRAQVLHLRLRVPMALMELMA
jgi:hypothetical protein